MSNVVPVPDIHEIEKMDMEQQKWIDALEISDDKVKCQKCGISVPLGKALAGPVIVESNC